MKSNKIENLMSMLFSLEKFTEEMLIKLIKNLSEKGVSFRAMNDEELKKLLGKYLVRKDYVSVANVAFMLAENEGDI